MSTTISKEEFRQHVAALKVPKGFTAEMTEEDNYMKGEWREVHSVYVLKSPTIEIRIHQLGYGTTNFLSGNQWLTFDRRGVEASFYHLPFGDWDKGHYNLNAIVKEQLQRVKKQLKRSKNAMPVPGIPFTVSPEELSKLRAQLKKRGSISFMPGGFGTGYGVSRSRLSSAKRASRELEKFLEASPLFVTTMDCD